MKIGTILKQQLIVEAVEANAVTIITLNKRLSAALGHQFQGSVNIISHVQKSDGVYDGVKFNIADGKHAIRYNIRNNVIYSIDFWINYSFQPQYSLENAYEFSEEQLLEICTNFFLSGQKDYQLEEGYVITESDGAFDFGKFVHNILNGSPLQIWFKKHSHDEEIGKLVMERDFIQLYKLYKAWAEGAGEKVYSIERFSALVKDALKKSGLTAFKSAQITSAKVEQIIVDEKEKKIAEFAQSIRLTPDEVYDQLENYVTLIAKKKLHSLIVCGDTGMSKSYTVTKVLKDLGLVENDKDDTLMPDPDEAGEDEYREMVHSASENEFIFIKGKISVAGTYDTLYVNNGKLIVFDDCDSVFDSTDGINLLKAATDTVAVRKMSMRNRMTMSGKGVSPASFPFEGRLIFITNKYLWEIDPAIKGRAVICQLNFTAEEVIERLRGLIKHLGNDIKGVTEKDKIEVLDYLLSFSYAYEKLDFRSYLQCLEEKMRSPKLWKKIAANSVLLKNQQE